jgi:hypothetical protein
MLVFIDESGDAGFKIDRGSSPVFVTSMVMFEDHDQADQADRIIGALMRDLKVRPEFKFTKCSNDYRDRFFDAISGCGFRCRSVVVQKDLIHSNALRTVKESFYKYFVRMMMQHDGGALQDAKVYIDGCGERTFRNELKTYIRRHIPAVKDVKLRDSKNSPLIQLADMTAGAIARSYRQDREDHMRWRDKLQRSGKIHDLWEFG